jgi:hypothetical protein
LIIPKTYGEPVAFFGVPNTELLAAAVVLLDAGALEPAELAELVELLELQAAAVSASTAAAVTLSHLCDFICASFGDGVYLSVSVSQRRPAQAAVSPR